MNRNKKIIINTKLVKIKDLHKSCSWAIRNLKNTLKQNKVFSKTKSTKYKYSSDNIIYLATKDSDLSKILPKNNFLPLDPESFALIPILYLSKKIIIAYGADSRGLVYALTELSDRFLNNTNKNNYFNIKNKIIERPVTKIRSISKCFESNIEDLKWFHNRVMWRKYLSMLVTQRFNRFTLTFGMQYNYPYGNEFITDVYLYLAYPFLVSPKGYNIYAEGLSNKERNKNLQTLKFISSEAVKCGLDFQLALWTQKYDFDKVPNANYQIKKAPKKNYAEYCRDSLSVLLKECPDITGITLRAHVECGIPEGKYQFWKTYFEAFTNAGRVIEIDLHAKGIDNKMINLALKSTTKVNVSPKYISEHMGLPYHQASIRKQEMPPRLKVDSKWTYSEGSRRFQRYSYGDLLREDRKYGVLFRIWPGTQRILLWGDPILAGGYGSLSTFCGSLGVELCEPLSFKGRMGTGIKGGRFNYIDKKLQTKYDWEKYNYTYRVWGRLNYNPKTKPENYQRFMIKNFGKRGLDLTKSLGYASRILPFITLAHGVSASNNSYWPEMYENMSIVHKAPFLPYSYDLKKPSRFGMSTSCDPQLLMSPQELAKSIFNKTGVSRYSPLTMANWLENFSKNANKYIGKYKKILEEKNPSLKRLLVDIIIQASIGQFFAEKIRSACFWEYFLLSGSKIVGEKALVKYIKARDQWQIAADISKEIYLPDLTYGPQSWLRGRWDDRLPAIENDIIEMKSILEEKKTIKSLSNYEINKNLKVMENWNDYQKIKVEHKPPKNFVFNKQIILNCCVKLKKDILGFLHYRHVNQSIKWEKIKLVKNDDNLSAKIPSSYTKTPFPLQYYFEFINKDKSSFSPGLNINLSNQPYYVIRQKELIKH